MKVPPQGVEDGFSHYAEQYMCKRGCCRPCHAVEGAKRVGAFMVFAAALHLFILSLGFFGQASDQTGQMEGVDSPIFQGFMMMIEGFLLFILFTGIKKFNPRMVLVYVVYLGIVLFFLVILTVMNFFTAVFFEAIIDSISKGENQDDNPVKMLLDTMQNQSKAAGIMELRMMLYFILFFLILASLIEYWFFNIVRRCYFYMKDYEEHRKIYATVVFAP